MRRWWEAFKKRREVGRPIPWPYSSLMTWHEKEMWTKWGWRVNYWTCPTCGARRREGPPFTYYRSINFPPKACECPGD